MKTLDSWNSAGKVLTNIDAKIPATFHVVLGTLQEQVFVVVVFLCHFQNDRQVWLIATKSFWQMPVTYSSTLN